MTGDLAPGPVTGDPATDPAPPPAVRVAGRVALLAGASLVAVLLGVWFTGAALPSVLRDPGVLVRWGLPVVSTLAELAGSLTLGALVLAVAVLPRTADRSAGTGSTTASRTASATASGSGSAYPRSLLVAGVAAAVWTLLGIAHLVLTYASVAGLALDAPTFGGELGDYVTSFELGRSQLTVVALAAVVAALCLVVATPTGAAWATVGVVVALWQQAQTGHAAGATSHELATSSMFVHLVGAAVWVGGLAALAILARRLGPDLRPALTRFSVIAGWCLVAVGLSGLLNAVIRLGGLDGLTTRYGLLVLLKAVLLVALGLLGLAHRRATIRALPGPDAPAGPGVRLFWRLVLVELAVMGAVSGVAVALGSSAPPVPQEAQPATTPALIVTGHVLPPEPTFVRWLTVWRWDVVLAGLAVVGLVVYLRWVWRLRRRGDAWPALRTVSWVAGMVIFFWTTNGGPAMYGHVLFSAHMIQHMVLAMVVPVLIALSAPVTLALRALPARPVGLRGDTSRGPREWILVLVHSRWGTFVANPVVAAANFAGSMVVFYYTDLFEWTLRNPVGHIAMAVHFSIVGYMFVNGIVGIDPGPKRPGYPQRLLLLFATMGFHAFFGVALMSGEALLVADWFGLLGRPWGPSALLDQQEGGAIAWGIGELPTVALAIAVAVQWSRADDRTARRRDRTVEREGDLEMDEYNAMLARISERDGSGTV